MSLEVEPTFLAHVANAMWLDADMEMRKIACRTRYSHALFHVKQLHSFDLVFHGSGESARLVMPAICRQLLLDEVHCSMLATHFGARKMHKLLSQRVWWPHMRQSFRKVCREC